VRNTWVMLRKELSGYFSSPLAYVLLAGYVLIFGFFFALEMSDSVHVSMEAQLSGQSMPFNVNERVIRPVLATMATLGIFILPLITMRLFAEEKRNGTIELLATSPVRDHEIILAKWLAAMGLYGSMLLVSGLNLIFLFRYSHPDWKPLLIAYLGLLLQAGSMLAVGTFISSLTKNQIIAVFCTYAALLFLWISAAFSYFDTSTVANALAYLSLTSHYESFSKGVIETKDLLYYLSLIFLGLFFTSRSLDSLRWRS